MNSYFVAKVKYVEAVPDTDKEKKKTVQVLVDAMTCQEAEVKVLKWIPSNWKDYSVIAVNPSVIADISKEGPSETWYDINVKYEGENGKWTNHHIAANGSIPEDIVKRVLRANGSAAFESAKRLKCIIDEDIT